MSDWLISSAHCAYLKGHTFICMYDDCEKKCEKETCPIKQKTLF